MLTRLSRRRSGAVAVPAGPEPPGWSLRRRLFGIAGGASLAVVAGLALWVIVDRFVHSGSGQRYDEAARWAVTAPDDTTGQLVDGLNVVSVSLVAGVSTLWVVAALVRRQVARAVGVVVLIGGANVSTQILKRFVIDRPELGVGSNPDNTLPSGHVTVVLSLALAAVLVLPARWRSGLAAVTAAVGTLVGAAVLLGRWHRPSDVLAAYAVCAVWAGVAVATVALLQRAASAEPSEAVGFLPLRHLAAALVGASAVGAVLIVNGLARADGTGGPWVGAQGMAAVGLMCAAVVASVAAAGDLLGSRAADRGAGRGAVGDAPVGRWGPRPVG